MQRETREPLPKPTRRWLPRSLLSTPVLLLCISLPAGASVLINFEDLPATPIGTPATVHLENQYMAKGVVFTPGPGLVALDFSAQPGFAHSGTKAIEQCYSQEFCFDPIEMHFTRPQKALRVWVGYSAPLTANRTAQLTAYDGAGHVVGTASTTFTPSSSRQPIRRPLTIALSLTSSAEILRAEVALTSMSTVGTPTNSLAVDDLEFTTALCLRRPNACVRDDRFQIDVQWRDFRGGTGVGTALPITEDTGGFWFFDPDNVELLVKVLDGRRVNGHWWVFYGALSNVEYTLTVTDTWTGAQKVYNNPLRHFGSLGDTLAFSDP